jgi:hypothetical protein
MVNILPEMVRDACLEQLKINEINEINGVRLD